MDKRAKKLTILLGMGKPSMPIGKPTQQTSKEVKKKNSKKGGKKK